ncbi:MAG: hypothetical protein ACRDVZ_11445 [Jiangellaceae bacterium]
MPASAPVWLREAIPYVRPGSLRRRLRRAHLAAHPRIVRATSGTFRQLAQRTTDHHLSRIVAAVRILRPELSIMALAPRSASRRALPIESSPP